MRYSKSAQLETAPTKHEGESVYLFLELTIVFGFLTTLFEKARPGDRISSGVSGFGNPSYRKTK